MQVSKFLIEGSEKQQRSLELLMSQQETAQTRPLKDVNEKQ